MGQNGCRPGDLTAAVRDANPGSMPGKAPNPSGKPLSATSFGGGSKSATYPVADSHQARVNDGRTEERGPVVRRMNRDWEILRFSERTHVFFSIAFRSHFNQFRPHFFIYTFRKKKDMIRRSGSASLPVAIHPNSIIASN